MPKNYSLIKRLCFEHNVFLWYENTVLIFSFISIKESISDFYWYYSGKDVIDEPGKKNFSKAMTVAKQIFNSLTEYIQVKFEQNRHLHRLVVYYVCNTQFLSIGPLHGQPAVSSPQQAVGCYCWVPSCLCPHDDEAGTGTHVIPLIIPSKWKIWISCTHINKRKYRLIIALLQLHVWIELTELISPLIW